MGIQPPFPKGKKYLYTIPLETVFPVNLCALVISLNQRKVRYKGCKVALTNGHYIFLTGIDGNTLKIEKGQESINIVIAPFYLKQLDNLWFLFGQLIDGKIAIYQLEKISNLSILSDLFTHPEVNYQEFYDNLNCDDIINFDIDDSATFYWMQNMENETNRDYHGETIFTGIL